MVSFLFWCQDPIQRILHSQSFDTVKYLSDPNEGVILFVLPDVRQPWRLVCRNMMRGYKLAELTALSFLQKSFVSFRCFFKWTICPLFIRILELNENLKATLLFLIFSRLALNSSSTNLPSHWVQHLYCSFLAVLDCKLKVDSLSCYVRHIHLVRLESTRQKATVTEGDKSCGAD